MCKASLVSCFQPECCDVKQDIEMRQVLSFQLDNCDIRPVLYYDETTLYCEDDEVSIFILIHIDADDDGIPLRMTMLLMKKTSDDL